MPRWTGSQPLSRADWPALADVTQTDDLMGPLLYAGARVERGAPVYSGDDDPDGSCTAGNAPAGGEPLLYMYMTSDMELPSDAEVDAERVRCAVHESTDTGARPMSVDWQPWRAEPAVDPATA